MTAETWDAAIKAFDDAMRVDGGRSQGTRWQYCQHVRWVAQGVQPAGPWELTTPGLARWLELQNWSNETRRKVLVSVRAFYAWGVRTDRLEWAPTAGLPSAARRTPGPRPTAFPERWREPYTRYVAWLRASSKSEGTIGQYRFRLKLLAEVAGDPWKVSTEELAAWLSNPDWSPQTKRCSAVAVGSFYRWAAKTGQVAESPVDGLDTIRVPAGMPRPTPNDALQEALARADDRTRLALLLAAHAGLRIGEAARLHFSEVSEAMLLVHGKGGKQRVVPLAPGGDLGRELRAERNRRRERRPGSGFPRWASEGGWVFPSSAPKSGHITPQHLGRVVARAIPGEEWTAHTLRHLFATRAYAAERDLQAVQRLLGHARPETTAIYAQVPDGALLSAVAAASTGW
ncbi:tyrosine-type recombinase/integrase [Nocardioides sp.]|uniref:tyrosine-type recombinase/integrase n=1 Tax=Nocardioides sp. TaxID=35761 RepID=UPI0037838651